VLCVDTNCWIAYFAGEPGKDIDLLGEQLDRRNVIMAPVVLSELFSDPALDGKTALALAAIPLLETGPGYWERAGRLRASLRWRDFRPKLADTLIAQSCIDHRVPLLTRDRGFRTFHKYAGLDLAL
jgi:predicted nucleic acid-binding protein